VRTGRLPPRLAHILSQVARTREDADYDAAVAFADEDARGALAQSTAFVTAARGVLEHDGWLAPGS
jgi:uncharacterized protein (UPF0332 family)